jgi:hypothetical protein
MAWPNGKAPEGKKWKKGQSGNPGGRPSIPKLGRTLGIRLKERVLDNDGHLAEKIITALIQKAVKGDWKAAQLVLEYVEGRPAQTMNLNTNESPKVKDIDQQLAELRDGIARRAAALENDGRGKESTAGVAGDAGKDTRLQ